MIGKSKNFELNKRLREAISCLQQAQLYLYNPYEIKSVNKKNLKALISIAKKQLLIYDINKLLNNK